MVKKLHIALIGYGKMGREIEQLAISKGHTVDVIIDNNHQWDEHGNTLSSLDVAIEFSTPETAPENIRKCFKYGIPVVCGTTGWYKHLPAISAECTKKDQALFYAPNFSLGVNIMFELNARLARLMSDYPHYAPKITEIHHTHKLDAPSGTALVLAEHMLSNRNDLTGWTLEIDHNQGSEIPIEALRIGQTPGTHIVSYASAIDSIEIKHIANNRKGFTEGALMAAEWLCGKKGVFTMKHLMNL